jgi:hypothetical protein
MIVRMPMNRNLTWGDRQAEVAREKQLAKLRKLAAQAPKPAETASDANAQPTGSGTKAAPAKASAAKSVKSPAQAKKKSAAPAKSAKAKKR